MCLSVQQSYSELVEKAYEAVVKKYGSDLNNKRLKHILGVAKLAKELAIRYNIDPSKAQICALMHDYYKYESYEEMASFLTPEEEKECENCKVLYHSYASSKALTSVLGIYDEEMISAVKYHVFGHPNMTKLEEIILIADYTEENREYEACKKCRKILLSGAFNTAIYESTKLTIEFLLRDNKKPHPMQYEVLNEYERKINMDKINIVIEALKKVNATDVICYDTDEKSPFFSNVIVASVDSVRQLNASLEYIKDMVSEAGFTIKSTGGANTEWVIVDICDVLVHVFYKEERQRFQIDKLYLDCKVVNI